MGESGGDGRSSGRWMEELAMSMILVRKSDEGGVYRFTMEAEYQLINNSDKTIITQTNLEHPGVSRTMPDWAENDAKHFRKAIDDGYNGIARLVFENILATAEN